MVKLHYKLDRDWLVTPDRDIITATIKELGIVVTSTKGATHEGYAEIRENLKKAVDSWIEGFGKQEFEDHIKLWQNENEEFDYQIPADISQ